MGMDLIVAYLVIDKGKAPDFEAGRKHLATLADEDLGTLFELYEDGEDARRAVLDRIETLEQIDEYRDSFRFTVRDAEVWLGGGSSWGDSPGDVFDAINDLQGIPGILDAMGFDA